MRQGKSAGNPECPAIEELANVLQSCFPKITLWTTNNESPGTRHTSGLAIDIMLDVTRAKQRLLAHGIISALVNNWPAMKWSDLLYSDFDGSAISYFHIPAAGGYGGANGMLRRSPYTADTRHGDHIHLDWVDFSLKNTGAQYSRIPFKWSKAAETIGFGGALRSQFSALAGSDFDPLGTDTARPVPTWLQGWWQVEDGFTYFYYFGKQHVVHYTKTRPRLTSQPAQTPLNKGSVSISTAPDRVVIDWNPADGGATRETFTPSPSSGSDTMRGVSNRYAPLLANKMA